MEHSMWRRIYLSHQIDGDCMGMGILPKPDLQLTGAGCQPAPPLPCCDRAWKRCNSREERKI